MIFKQETVESWFSGIKTSINNEVIQPFQNAEQVIWKYNQAIQHNSLTQKGWERLLAQSDDGLKAYLTNIKGTTASMTGYTVSLQGNITGFKKVSSAITQYNALATAGTQKQNEFSTAVAATNGRLGGYLRGLSGAKASLSGYVNSLVSATAKTIVLQAATMALNAAVSMGITAAISLAVKGFDKLINSTKRASDAANEAFSESNSKVQQNKEEIKTLDELIQKYKELRENENLDTEGRKQVKNLQNDIADLVGVQAQNLDLVNGKLDEEIIKLNEISEKQAKNAYETATANYNNAVRANKNAAGNSSVAFVDGYAYVGDREKEAEKILQDAGFIDYYMRGGRKQVGGRGVGNNGFSTIVFDTYDRDGRELKGAQEKADYLQSMIDILKQNEQRTSQLYDGLVKQRDIYLDYINDQQNAANSLINAWITYSQSSNNELSRINVDSVESFEKYRQKMIEEAKSDESIGQILADGTLSEESLEIVINDFMSTATQFSEWYEQWVGNVKGNTFNDKTPISLSLPDAIKKVNGFKEGDTEVIGLIEEYELLQEVLSDTGNIQEETYEKLLSCSSKYSTAIRTENGRITVNTSKLKAVAKSRQLDTKEAIRQTLALKKQEWVQWNQGIENYNGTLLENIETTYGDIDALQHQITQYELLVNSVDEASNAFKRFEAAQSVDEQDMFTTAQNAFDLVNETLNKTDSENYGKTNTKKFQYGMELLADDEDYEKLLNAESMEDYVRISKEIVKTLSPLFTENEGLGVDNLFKRADAIVDSGDIPKNDKEWADKLNTSVEMFQALKQRANLYEYNNREYFSSGFTNKLDEYQSRLSNVQSAQEALNECTDTTSNEYKRLSKELDDAKQKYNEFKNETADTVEDAYTGFIHSGAKSKGSFSDYLKQSMGMEDSDITGMIDVLLDKSKSLQENLSNMHPDSTAYELYKKQLDDVNSLIASLDFDIDSIDKTKSLEDKISQYKELAKEAEEYKKTLETEDSGSESYKEAAQELERISVLMNELRDPLRLEINSNISEIESQISQLDEKLKGLNEALKHASSSNEAYAIHMDIKGSENEKAKLEGQKKELQETVKLIVDSTEIDEYKPEEKEGTVKYSPDFSEVTNVTPPVLKGTVEYEAKMPNQPITPVSPKPKQADADGTFHAFAQGTGSDVSIAKDEKALVNELGEEGIVRNGKLIPVKGGAQFINLKRGDIIFNH